MRRYLAFLVVALGLLMLWHVRAGVATELPSPSLEQVNSPAAPLSLPAPKAASRPLVLVKAPQAPNPVPLRYRGFMVNHRDVPLQEKVIALTFDDGPSPQVTPFVLKALAQYKAKCTFFVMGQWVMEYPTVLRQEVAAGQDIESHSYSHPIEEVSIPHSTRELERAATIIEQISGTRPHIFRPPYGAMKWNMAKVAAKLGYCVVKWTVCGADGAKENAADIVHNVTVSPHPGDIVLLHDGHDHEETMRALPEILRRLSAKGYRFITVPQLLKMWDAAKSPTRSDHKSRVATTSRGSA